MIEFKKYEGSAELEELGTITDQIGDKGTATLLTKNFNNPAKRVVMLCHNDKGESVIISCSDPLSKQLRRMKAEGATKDELESLVIGLPIYENEVGPFIGLEAGERPVAKTIAQLKKVKKSEKVAITNPEELAW